MWRAMVKGASTISPVGSLTSGVWRLKSLQPCVSLIKLRVHKTDRSPRWHIGICDNIPCT